MTTEVPGPMKELLSGLKIPSAPRNSIKYQIKPATTKLTLDYVFADNPEEARDRAIERLGLQPGEVFTIHRVNETTGITGSSLNGIGITPAAPISPT